MGGRTYNPILGRFMQADPFVQAPANLQNYNRYSYVLNNPMSYTDPSGYNFVKKALKTSMKITGTHAALRALAKNKYLNMAVQAGVCFYGGPVACGAYSGAQTFAVTGSLRAGVKSGLITYGTALAFQEIGNQFSDASMSNIGDALANNGNFSGLVEFGGNLLTGGQVAAQISLHALVGGIGASLQGGNFGHGFFSAGVTKGAGGAWLTGGGNLSGGQVAYGTVVSAVIGGTASVIAGGKFENGAKTATFQYLYNHLSQLRQAAELSKQRDRMLADVRSLDLTTNIDRNILALYAGWFDVDATHLWRSHHDANTIRLNVLMNINTHHAQGMVPVIQEMAVNQYGGYARDAVLHVNPWTRVFMVPFCFVSDMLGGKVCG